MMQHGGLFKQPALAETLQRIANQGADDFYRGETAKLLVAQMQRSNGLITEADLDGYQAVWRAPLIGKWRDYTVVSAPPPSSGGFAVVQLLQMKELLDEEFANVDHNSAQYVHLVAEMEKRVFADRAEYFGDPDFVSIPMSEIMSADYIQRRAGEVNPLEISVTDDVLPGIESNDTTHFSIVDQWGNAVSNTYTINWSYGSGVVVEGAGFLLNNEMDDFSTKPGVPNVYGVIGGTANEIQPQKRMLSSMSPSIVLKDDKVDIVVGAMGGSTIFTTVFQVIANIVDFNMSAKQALDVGYFHHQLLPKDLVTTSVDTPLSAETTKKLIARGYKVEPHFFEFGNVQLVAIKDGKLTAAADPRGIGTAIVGSAVQQKTQ
jgi:gamma-glutamyltranspeptidase/glutathione hydrolase